MGKKTRQRKRLRNTGHLFNKATRRRLMLGSYIFVVISFLAQFLVVCKKEKPRPKIKQRIVGKSILIPTNEELSIRTSSDSKGSSASQERPAVKL
ncbi:hypothetical protein Q1695_003138 [Nippostrongylus brasiliensis]|nr:hypothetical protein Q1695_003138 [Nippostrongylus brasiliensis]